jgi:hypothetical protein
MRGALCIALLLLSGVAHAKSVKVCGQDLDADTTTDVTCSKKLDVIGLAKLKKLQSLRLRCLRVKSFSVIAKLPITELTVDDSNVIESWSSLRALPKLTHLSLYATACAICACSRRS